jgi:peptide/nickel transport system permease protein
MSIKYITKKFLFALLTLFCIVLINFTLTRFMPGDPVMFIVGEDEYLQIQTSNPDVIKKIRSEYGLDNSIMRQFIIYLGKLIKFDFDSSFRTKKPVLDTILPRIRTTLILAIPATFFAAIIGGALGLFAGWKKGEKIDLLFSPFMAIFHTIPANCLAMIFLLVFAYHLDLFPINGWTSGGLSGMNKFLDVLWHMFLPMSVLILLKVPSDFMLMKSSVSSIRNEDYVIVAMSRGFKERDILLRQVLKNAAPPFITSLCMQFGYVLSGSLIIEVVFSWPGMGMLINESVMIKDFPMLQMCFLILGLCVIISNLIADSLVQIIDPRVKEGFIFEG